MCDYSLCGVPNRLAFEGEELVTHRFRTGSMGLASLAELRSRQAQQATENLWMRLKAALWLDLTSETVTAVCIPPGAHLILRKIPENLRRQRNLNEEEDAFFVQTSVEANTYRDAIRFRTGTQLLLQWLTAGIVMRVISLEGSQQENRGSFTGQLTS